MFPPADPLISNFMFPPADPPTYPFHIASRFDP
jgi:hypothetical protein